LFECKFAVVTRGVELIHARLDTAMMFRERPFVTLLAEEDFATARIDLAEFGSERFSALEVIERLPSRRQRRFRFLPGAFKKNIGFGVSRVIATGLRGA
jgi:hypothetical protein